MRRVHHRPGDFVLQPWEADIEACAQHITALIGPKVDFGIHSRIGRQGDLHLAGHYTHRADEASGPPGREKLLWISAAAWCARGGQVNVEASVRAARSAVTPASCVRLRGVENLVELSHGNLL